MKWKDQDIIVMDKVVISSPYQPENCRPIGTGSTQQYDIAVKQIKKVVCSTLYIRLLGPQLFMY